MGCKSEKWEVGCEARCFIREPFFLRIYNRTFEKKKRKEEEVANNFLTKERAKKKKTPTCWADQGLIVMFPWRFLSPLLACFSVGVFFCVCVCVCVWSERARRGGGGGEGRVEGRGGWEKTEWGKCWRGEWEGRIKLEGMRLGCRNRGGWDWGGTREE